jgi:hypothetical protein
MDIRSHGPLNGLGIRVATLVPVKLSRKLISGLMISLTIKKKNGGPGWGWVPSFGCGFQNCILGKTGVRKNRTAGPSHFGW